MKPKFYFLGLIFLLISGIGAAQTGIVSGFVTDSQDSSLANVNVYISTRQKKSVDAYCMFYLRLASTLNYSKHKLCRNL